MGARSRRKGARWERAVARMLESVGVPAQRNLEEVRSGNSGDLDVPPDVPLCVQAKVGARPPIYAAVREAQEAAEAHETPVAIIRRNGSGSRPPDDLAVLPLGDFIALAGELWGDDRHPDPDPVEEAS